MALSGSARPPKSVYVINPRSTLLYISSGHNQLSDRSLTGLPGHHGVALGENAVGMVVGLIVVEQFRVSPFPVSIR
jgi:hypothetical protein